MSVNTTGLFLCYQLVGRKMIELGSKDGRIIGASSIGGKQRKLAMLRGESYVAHTSLSSLARSDIVHGVEVRRSRAYAERGCVSLCCIDIAFADQRHSFSSWSSRHHRQFVCARYAASFISHFTSNVWNVQV